QRHGLETRDPSIARGEVAPPRMEGPHHKIDGDAAGIIEGQIGIDLAPRSALRAAGRAVIAVAGENVGGALQRVRITHLQADAVGTLCRLCEDQRVVFEVRPERSLSGVLVDRLQTQNALGEIGSGADVAPATPEVAELFYGDLCVP